MKFKLLVIFLLALFILPAQQIMAKLVLEGTLATDITFEKSSIGSIIANPDVYFPASTKLGLIMKSDDSTEQIRAYFPFLLNLSTLQIGNNLGQYLTGSEVSPDNWRQFFGSNYYFVAKGNPLVAGLANR